MNAKPATMLVLLMKSVTILVVVTNVSIWDVHLGTNRFQPEQQTGISIAIIQYDSYYDIIVQFI